MCQRNVNKCELKIFFYQSSKYLGVLKSFHRKYGLFSSIISFINKERIILFEQIHMI